MLLRATGLAFALSLLTALGLGGSPAAAEGARTVLTTENSDYFGFDLRTVQNIPLAQCKSACLGDNQCRAFTYNTKAKWCFLKSDFNKMNAFPGAVAGKVVDMAGGPDIGAPPTLGYLPYFVVDEATAYKAAVLRDSAPAAERGLRGLIAAGDEATAGGDPRTALSQYSAAAAIAADDGSLWQKVADAAIAAEPAAGGDQDLMRRIANDAGLIAYQLSRSTEARAAALATLGAALDKRAYYRPAMSAYEASLALAGSAGIEAAYADLKERQGFRIVGHTVDSDNATPRVCVQFSEDLVKSGVDYASFVTVDDAAPKSVEASGREVCVEGLDHSHQYRIAVRQGLPAAIGEIITKPAVLNVYVRDRAPTLRFTGESFVLPSTARRGIPIVTVNAASAKVQLYRVGERSIAALLGGSQFLRQLDGYDAQRIGDELGEPVWQGKIDVKSELNKEIVTSFPIDEALPQRKSGIYVMTAAPEGGAGDDDYSTKATQWFVVSDIGLTTFDGGDGLAVFTRSLASAKPIAGVALSLIARNNEVLGKAVTDGDGRVSFDAGLMRGAAGMAPAVVMADNGGTDFVFLDLTRSGFDLSDRGVGGRAAPGALDVLAWTERGIYRVGETVHVAALARDDAENAVDDLPLTFVFHRPDGVEDRRVVSDGRALGGHAVDLALSQNAMRGTWQVTVHTDPKQAAIATQTFLVDDFAPDRVEFDMASDRSEIAVGETAHVTVDGRYLYGAPGADLDLEGEVGLSTLRQSDKFPGYWFGLADEEAVSDSRIPLDDLPSTDETGKAVVDVALTSVPSTTRFLKAQVALRMREGSGRAVERRADIRIKPSGDMIGIKPEFTDDQVPQGGTASFKVIATDAEGRRAAANGLAWSLIKVERDYQWYRQDNSWSYEPITSTTVVTSGTVDARTDGEASISVPVDWGRYRLQVESNEASGPASSYEFDGGWYVAASSTETPDGLEIALDKATYAAGETARLKVSPRFAGELLLTVGAERVLASRTVTVPAGGATVDIPVDGAWGAGAYVMATLYRPGDSQDNRMPSRAIGLKWLGIDPGKRKLDVGIEAVAKSVPRQALTVPVSVGGLVPGEEAYVTVAAVDVGILNLTRYTPPDPDGWYFGQRQLGLEMRDLYGRLIDGSLGLTGRLRTGGDGGGMAVSGNPPKEKLLAFFTGPVKVDADGRATVSFEIPQFNGTARLMAVAWSKTAIGHGVEDVIVRDPVVVTASMPKFLAPGDEAELRLEIANTDGPAGRYDLDIETSKGVSVAAGKAPASIELAAGARKVLALPLRGETVGDASVVVRLAHADGTTVENTSYLPVRPAVMPVTTRTLVSLKGNGGSITVDRELLSASLIEGASVAIGVSRNAAFDVPALLMKLDRYPYGCAEQTTSRALPLLYVSELAASSGMPEDPDLHDRVQQAIFRVLNYQSSAGSFGLWGPGSGDLWLDAYVTDFLTRARELRYDVPQVSFDTALQNLGNALAYNVDLTTNGSPIAYALYVLSRNHKASAADLRYYADTQIGQFDQPLARTQIGASLALYGDLPRAEAAFASALDLARQTDARNWNRADYGSSLRDGAAMLALAAETRPLPSLVPAMIGYVAGVEKGYGTTSTQEDAWMLLAARAISAGNAAIALEVNGASRSGAFATRLSGDAVAADPVTIVNRSAAAVDAVVTTVAAPSQPLPAGGDGFSIERAYYNLDGTEANVTEAGQNDRFVVVVKMTEQNAWPSRVILTDLLPAGFQIDNPQLVGSADLAAFDWLPEIEVAHTEFRDDRFVAAFDRNAGSDREFTVAYVVRAVTPGVYDHPAATVEDMYRPQLSARTATGRMEVLAAK